MSKTSQEKLLLTLARILEQLSIDYYVTGGMAVSVWGRPRATFDIDIVIKLVEPEVPSLARALRKISKAGYIDEQMALEAIRHKGEFNFIDPESNLKVDFWIIKADPLSMLELKRRKVFSIDGQKVYFISPEDLILSKLRWYQESQSVRHLDDVETVFRISGKQLDMQYLKQWAQKLGMTPLLQGAIKKSEE